MAACSLPGKKSKLPAWGVKLNGGISEDAKGLFLFSEKLEKKNRGQTLKKINKKETKNLKSESVYPAPLQFMAGVVCSLPCGRI